MVKNVDQLINELRLQGFTAVRGDVGVIDTSAGEYENLNTKSLCRVAVTRGEQKADVVWFDNSYVQSMFIICDDPIFRQAISDSFFTDSD